MKYMNIMKKYGGMNLQLFAEGGAGSEGDNPEDDDPDNDPEDDDDGEDDPDEKRFSQKDMDAAIEKRLARERRKWQREQRNKAGADGGAAAGKDEKNDTADNTQLKDAESRASKAEVKVACYEAGVSKDCVDDVSALAHAYMEADDNLDLEDAIEKVVKKYPHFKKDSEDSDAVRENNKGKAWGERHKGSGNKTTGVEAAFLKRNPGLKID